MSGIDVTVLIPVHNGEAFLLQALTSALGQEGVAVEVIVLDDASTDDTATIAHKFGDRVRLVSLDKQPNHICATNVGIGLARGEFISILHHDDYYLPGKLAQHVSLHRAHPTVGLSYSGQLYVDAAGRRLGSLRSPLHHFNYVVDGGREMAHLIVQNYVNFVNAFVPASVYETVGRFDERLWFSAEWDMWLRIARRWPVGYISQPLVCYRLHANSLTHAGTSDTVEYYEQLRRVVDDLQTDTTLPAEARARLPVAVANMHLSTAMLKAVRAQWGGAMWSALRAATSLPPWKWPQLVRSAVLVPRVGSRLRLRRRAGQWTASG